MPPESSARSDRKYEMSKVGDRVYVNPDRPLETLTLVLLQSWGSRKIDVK